MHNRRDGKVNALRSKHQRGKARQKVNEATYGQYVAPIDYRR